MMPIPRGIRNNNPGNIRIGQNEWKGKIGDNTDGVFEQFVSVEYGIRALIILLHTYYRRGIRTLNALVSTYAPDNENDTKAYIAAMTQKTGIKPTEIFIWNKRTVLRIVKAITQVENGGDHITDEQLEDAWNMLP